MDLTNLNGTKKQRRKVGSLDLGNMMYGKIPPQARDLEEAILGGMMLEPVKVSDVKQLLQPNDFYVEANQRICKVIYEVSKNNSADIVLVVEALKVSEELNLVGGPYYVMQLTNKVVSTANIESYCRIVKQKSIMRRLIAFSSVIIGDAYEDSVDVFDLLDQAESQLKGINFELDEMKITPISNIAMRVIEKFDTRVYNAKNNIVDVNSVYTKIKDWDIINGSLFPGLFVVAGRPGMGKGIHLTEMACRMGKDINVGIINGEMTDEQLLTRIGCNLLGIDNYLFKKEPSQVTEKDQQLLYDAMNEALLLKLHVENSRYINKIANKIKLWVEKYEVKCILADFLTLFKVPSELERYYTKTQQVDYILDVFTQLCKDLKVPIILYVQMNREILGRSGIKEPSLADLKQSGSIEELAYQVSFLHRPEYYDENSVTDEMGESTKGLCYQIIAKHRDGKLGRIKLRANLACSQMKEWSDNTKFSFEQNAIIEDPF